MFGREAIVRLVVCMLQRDQDPFFGIDDLVRASRALTLFADAWEQARPALSIVVQELCL